MTGMSAYDAVLLVYNPHSTGGAEQRAQEFVAAVAERAPDLDVRMVPTEYAGHARVIAAKAEPGTLVVSVSGDGGFNEVVSGVMDAGDGRSAATPVAVLPAGNANDHRRTTARRPLVDAVTARAVDHLDVLRVTLDDAPPFWAHSYVGFGISPTVALELEKGGKGALREIFTTIRSFARFRPFEIVQESGVRQNVDSLILANIREMAKYATLSDEGDPSDGMFEVVTLPHVGRFRMLLTAVRAALRGLGPQPKARRYAFGTTAPMPMQLDGEVHELDGPRWVVVEILPRAIATVR